MGRMIWLRGGDRERAMEKVEELMLLGDIRSQKVWSLSPPEFVTLMSGGLERVSMEHFEVLVVGGFEDLKGESARAFLAALHCFRAFHVGIGMRLILTSGVGLSVEMHRIHELMPVVIDLAPIGNDPEDMNSRVHSLIDFATRLTEVPIRRITERAAHFLEESVKSGEGEEVLVLLVEGIRRSDGRTLRFRDLLPNFSPYFDPDDQVETYCN